MRRNSRRVFNESGEVKKMLIISFSVLIIAILSFVAVFFMYKNHLNNKTEIAKERMNLINNLDKNNQNKETIALEQASSNFGKTVNEVETEATIVTNEEVINKVAINTSNMVKESMSEENSQVNSEAIETSIEVKKEEKVPDPIFIKPVEGDITTEFATDTLIYSSTLQEWVTHNGIDIKADKATIVKAAAEGTVKSIKNDPRYGITVVIEHVNGYETIYSNLLTAEFVKEGEELKQGQTIGTVGSTATFEIAETPHLHFEILKDSQYLNPSSYIR